VGEVLIGQMHEGEVADLRGDGPGTQCNDECAGKDWQAGR